MDEKSSVKEWLSSMTKRRITDVEIAEILGSPELQSIPGSLRGYRQMTSSRYVEASASIR